VPEFLRSSLVLQDGAEAPKQKVDLLEIENIKLRIAYISRRIPHLTGADKKVGKSISNIGIITPDLRERS
jgi:hypothetical protein